jgi:phenylacetate-coenzyme A ligase PaaK-like adenylate-forming protein
VVVEVLGPDGEPLEDGELGEIVATLLHSHEMPIIRYRTGDAGSRPPGSCPCGRTLARLDVAVGRLEDMVKRADGRLANARFIRATYEQLLGKALRGHRTEQVGPGRFEARLELDGAVPGGLANAVAEHLSAHLGEPVRVELDIGPIPDREPGRKLRTFRRRWGG